VILELDTESLLVHVSADADLAALEAELAKDGLTLDVKHQGNVGAWLADGAPGARSAWLDPADHLVAGWTARIRATSEPFTVHPAPRRAVGPDLLALVMGMKSRWLSLTSVWLRVHRVGVARPTVECALEEPPALNDGERTLLEALDTALS
jgi:alkyldihydroxyacetonephosphate synthase